jgi:hypothetical protein
VRGGGFTVWRDHDCVLFDGVFCDEEFTTLLKLWARKGHTLFDFELGKRTGANVLGSIDALNAWRAELGIEPITPTKPKKRRAASARVDVRAKRRGS